MMAFEQSRGSQKSTVLSIARWYFSGFIALSIGRYLLIFMTMAVLLSNSQVNAAEKNFTTDCSPNGRLRCRVEEGNCNANQRADNYPAAPFELKISPFILARHLKKPNPYRLLVNITWQPTFQKSINKTVGFELNILDKETNQRTCFTFHLESPQWVDKDRFNSVRFQFSTVDIFEFGHRYYVEIQSLPKPSVKMTLMNKTNSISSDDILMPVHPEQFLLKELNRTGYFESESSRIDSVDYCKLPAEKKVYEHGDGAHPHAVNWIGAFRLVYVHPKAKYIYVDFVAAPSQYCFEQYELNLIRDQHLLVDHTVINTKDLYYEIHGNVSVAFGNHTFQNVTPGVYEIGLKPVSHSAIDSHCLCPAPGKICTCHQAVWSEVRMPEPPAAPTPPPPCDQLPPFKLPFDCPMNATRPEIDSPENQGGSRSTIILGSLLGAAFVLIIAGILLLRFYYKRYKKRGTPHIYLLPVVSTNDFDPKFSKTTDTEMTQILHPVKLLIIYSHDCPDHEAAVRAFSDYLQAQCLCDVKIDYLCVQEINANKFDWAYRCISEADRVLLVNSYGAYMRFQAKLMADSNSNDEQSQGSTIVERRNPDPYDDLFLLQLDFISQQQQQDSSMALKFVSVYFSYTPAHFILPHGNPHLRYQIPQHLRSLMIDLHQLHSYGDDSYEMASSIPPRLREANMFDYVKCAEGENLRKSIQATQRYIDQNPDWFEQLHVRRRAVIPNIPKLSPLKKPSNSLRNGLIHHHVTNKEQTESLLPECSSENMWSEQRKKPESTADSGYEEPELQTFDDHMNAVVAGPAFPLLTEPAYDDQSTDLALGNDSNIRLLENDGGKSMANLDSCDSGIAVEFHCPNTNDPYYSPKAGSKMRHLNGVLHSPSKSEKRVDHAPLEKQRLIC